MRERERRSRPFARRLRADLTEAELILWSQLSKRTQWAALFRRQHPVGPYIVDFACIEAMLVVEIDGATHSSDEEIAHDRTREGFLVEEGWMVMRVTNDDVYRRLGVVLDAVWRAVDARRGGHRCAPL